jgi:hypothetical protein
MTTPQADESVAKSEIVVVDLGDESPRVQKNKKPPVPSNEYVLVEGKSSAVWKHFLKEKEGFCVCIHCGGTIAVKDGETTTLQRHVDRQHPLVGVYSQLQENAQHKRRKQTSITTFTTARGSQNQYTRNKSIDELFEKFIFLAALPLSVCDNPHLMEFCKSLGYTPMARQTLGTTSLMKWVSMFNGIISQKLSSLPQFSVTFDFWDSRGRQDFLGITAHGVDNDWKMQRICIGVIPFHGESHTGENICAALHETLVDRHKVDPGAVLALVSDNASNVTSGSRLFKEKFTYCDELSVAYSTTVN